MFHKPFKVKTQTAIKGSERKRLRNDIGKSFPSLTPDDLLQIVPNKEDMSIVKIYTHHGESLILYCVLKNPVFIEVFKELVPTVYTLWKFPDLLPIFRTYPPVFTKLKGGADLMLPGVFVEGEVSPYTFGKLQKGELCSVSLLGNKASVAVGRAALSGSDMFESAMRGKGVEIVHLLGDELWAFGDKSQPPVIPDGLILSSENGEDFTDGASCKEEVEIITENKSETNKQPENSETMEESVNICSNGIDELDLTENIKDSEIMEENNTTEEISSLPDNMDELLDICFKCALKSSVKKSDLPLLTSAFFKNHMVKYCPPGKTLDVKKSGFKKLSKFLQKMQKEGYIKVKELSKGADSIVEVDKSQLRDFEPPFVINEDDSQPITTAEFVPPKLTEMYSITAAVVPLFKEKGKHKGNAVTVADVRTCISDYVKNNNLQNENDKSQIQLDPLIADIVLSRGENDIINLSWEDVLKRIIDKMSPVLCIEYPEMPPIFKKGKVDGVKLDVQQRSGNKKVTIIHNVETFGIDPKELAHTVQVGVACSSSVVPADKNSNKGVQIVIQGNQIHYIADLLLNKYRVPRKYIIGLEKATKRR